MVEEIQIGNTEAITALRLKSCFLAVTNNKVDMRNCLYHVSILINQKSQVEKLYINGQFYYLKLSKDKKSIIISDKKEVE